MAHHPPLIDLTLEEETDPPRASVIVVNPQYGPPKPSTRPDSRIPISRFQQIMKSKLHKPFNLYIRTKDDESENFRFFIPTLALDPTKTRGSIPFFKSMGKLEIIIQGKIIELTHISGVAKFNNVYKIFQVANKSKQWIPHTRNPNMAILNLHITDKWHSDLITRMQMKFRHE